MSYKFGSFVFLSVFNARSLHHQVFLIFFHNVRHHKVRRMMNPSFWKKVQMGLKGSKSCKNGQKMRFLRFFQKSYPFRYVSFCFSTKSTNVVLTFCKKTCLEKIWFSSYGPSTLRTIRMQNFLNYNIAQKSWSIKLNFRMWLT